MSDLPAPAFAVVAGDPDDVELAALTVALTAVLTTVLGRRDRPEAAPPAWARPQRHAAPGSWCARSHRW